jgi:hypothetical protein
VGIKGLGRVALVICAFAGTLVGHTSVSTAQPPGGELVEEVLAHEVGENAQVRLDDTADFSASGGEAILEPGTSKEEAFSYERVDPETDRLIGLTRPEPAQHAAGAFVEAVGSPSSPSPSSSPTEPTSEPTPTAASPDEDGSTSQPDSASPAEGVASTAQGGSAEAQSAEVIPDPCDISAIFCDGLPPIECEGCDTVVEAVLELVRPCLERSECATDTVMTAVRRVIYEACGTEDILECETKFLGIVEGLIAQLCPNGVATCGDPYVNFVADLVMDVVCPSGSLFYCIGEINRQVDEVIDFAVGLAMGVVTDTCGGETTDECIARVLELLDRWVFQTVCGSSDFFTCTNNLGDDINDLVANACSLHVGVTEPNGGDALTYCVNRALQTVQLVMQTVDGAMITACQSTDEVTCANNVLDAVDDAIALACGALPVAGSGDVTGTPPGVGTCVLKAMGAINYVMATACGSTDPVKCAQRVIDEIVQTGETVHDAIANLCSGDAIGTIGSTDDSAADECVTLILETLDWAMRTACRSGDAVTCANNLLDAVDDAVALACGALPVAGSGDVTGTPPGVGTCVVKILGVLDFAMRQVCQSTDAVTCADNIRRQLEVLADTVNDALANTCESKVGVTAPTDDSAVTNCVELVIGIVHTSMNTACRSTDPLTCANNLLDAVDDAVALACGALPVAGSGDVTGTPPGVGTCVLKILGGIDFAMRQVCQSTDAVTCADNIRRELEALADSINDALANACESTAGVTAPTDDSALTNCVTLVVETVETIMTQACDSADALTCASNLIEEVDAALGAACGNVPVSGDGNVVGTPPGIGTCVLKVLGALEFARQVCESTDAATCGENIRREIEELYASLAPCVECFFPMLPTTPCRGIKYCEADVRTSPGQRLPDFVVVSGKTCATRSLSVFLYLPAGVTSKSVNVTPTEDGLCTQEVGEIQTEGSPGDNEPQDHVTDLEYNSYIPTLSSGELTPSSATTASSHDDNCYGASANYIHTSHTVQDAPSIDLAWLRTTSRRLWGCRSTWFSERYPRVFSWSGSGPQWWTHLFPSYEFTDWFCHPPAECGTATSAVHADFRTSWFTCSEGEGEQHVRITTWVSTYDNGDKSMWTTKNALCEGLHSATGIKVTSSMQSPYANDDAEDLYRCAVPDEYGRPEANGRTCNRPY